MNDWQLFKFVYDSYEYKRAVEKAIQDCRGYQNFPHTSFVSDSQLSRKINKLRTRQNMRFRKI